MRINADFASRALVVPEPGDWVSSPAPGVERLMLDRIGDEVARATSLVRYAAGSAFERHMHALGEEFLVLDGVFTDEHGDYPPGTYVRNPPGTGHSPSSEDGCRILVKLRQFDTEDLTPVVVRTADAEVWPDPVDGIATLPLHEYGTERVLMLKASEGRTLPLEADARGTELLVVSGALDYEGKALPPESWLRLPPGDAARLEVLEDCVVWIKYGHLPV